MSKTSIEWTDATWQVVTGCTKISPGCDNCYAETMHIRLQGMKKPGYEAGFSTRTLLPERLIEPTLTKKPKRYFVCSMSDLFHKDIPDEYLLQVFQTMVDCPQHTFQVLTKRPARAARFWQRQESFEAWPANVWMGTSVEQQQFTFRLNDLAKIPAPVRFVSAEPLLGGLSLRWWLERGLLQWTIVGGESGQQARPMNIDWARDLRVQCKENEVPFFFKQLGGRRKKGSGKDALLDGELYQEFPEAPISVGGH